MNKIGIFLLLFVSAQTAFSQEKLTVTCVDHHTQEVLTSAEIQNAKVYLIKHDGDNEDYGDLLNGQFEIDKNCHNGDEYYVEIQVGEYKSDGHGCRNIKGKLTFPLIHRRWFEQMNAHIRYFQQTELSDTKAKYATLAFINNELAYSQINNPFDSAYNVTSKSSYEYLGKVFNVPSPTRFDLKQEKWVPTDALNKAVINFKQKTGFEEVNAQIDLSFYRRLSGLKPYQLKQLGSQEIYVLAVREGVTEFNEERQY